MFNRLFKLLVVISTFIYTSSIFGVDLLGAKRYGVTDTANQVSAKVIKANQFAISSSFYYVSKPNISLIDGTYNTLEMNSASIWSSSVGYGLFDIVEFDLGVHFSHENMDSDIRNIVINRVDERTKASQSSTMPKDFDFSSVSGLVKVQVLDFSSYKLALSALIESAGKKSSAYTVTRSSKLSGGWIISNELDLGRYVEFGLNFGDIYTTAQQFGDYKVADRIFTQALITLKPADMFSVFVGGEYKHLKLNSTYTLTGDAFGGIKISSKNFELTSYFGKQVSESCLGYGPLSFGISLTYLTTPVKYLSSEETNNDLYQGSIANKKQVKKAKKEDSKPRLVASSSKEDLRFTQKDGVYYDDDGNAIDVQGSLKKEFQEDRDEFYDFDRKIQASRQGDVIDPAVITERYYQEELAKARAEKEMEHQKELRRQQLAEIQRKQDLRKQIEEEDRLERKYRNQDFDELNDLPEVTDDEVNWEGLK